MNDGDAITNIWIALAVIIIFSAVVFEVVILGIAFFYADEIECNMLWCEFKTTRSSETRHLVTTSYTTTTSSRTCLLNGEEINCSDVP